MATPAFDLIETEQLNNREAWLERRKFGIGASDAASILDKSPWKSRLKLWSEKVGLVAPDDLSDNEAVQAGIRLEPVIAEWYGEESGRKVVHLPPFSLSQHPGYPWMLTTPDGHQYDPDGLVEIKTTNSFKQVEWEDGPPEHYSIQVQHQLATTGARMCTLVVLIGGQKLRWFDIERDEKFIAELIAKEAEFWQMVVDEVPPEPDGSDSSTSLLKKLYPEEAKGKVIDLPPAAVALDAERLLVAAELAVLGKRKKEIDNWIKAWMKDAEAGLLPDGTKYTLTTTNKKSVLTPPTSFRTLRRTSWT